MGTQVSAVMLIADQPWQIKIMTQVAKQLRVLKPTFRIRILVTDYYTFLHQPSLLAEIEANDLEVSTLDDLYRSWQTKEEPLLLQDRVEFFSDSFRGLDFEFLKKTNQWIYGDERNYFYLPMSESWKEKVFLDTLIWCKFEIENFRPTHIYALERSTLPNNVIYEISKIEGILHKTLIPARIDNFWYFRDDFGRGVTEEFAREVEYLMLTKDEEAKVDKWISSMKSSKLGAYESLELALTKSLFGNKFNLTMKFLLELVLNCRKVYARLFERLNFNYKIVRLEQNLVKLTFSQFRQSWLVFMYSTGLWNPFDEIGQGQSFFLWALHARPEGSVLALNNGQDEIKQLTTFADQLPGGVLLAVKENIEMLGLRNPNFYRNISSHPKIILLGPDANLADVANLAIGVVGVSGTFLLEAALYGKPVFALGNPEFICALSNSTTQSANDFIGGVMNGQDLTTFQQARKYVAYIFRYGFDAKFRMFDNRLCESDSQIVRELIREINFN